MTEPVQTETSVSGVAAMVAQLGGVLLSVETVQSAVELVTRLAAETIPGTAGAGVTLVDRHGHRTTAASSPLVADADSLQYSFESGPCLTAWSEQVPVRVDDLAAETRWPQWTAAASDLGVQSVLSVPLLSPTTSVGAMKVYSHRAHTYDHRSEEVLSLFAEQAAVLLANMLTLADARTLTAQLNDALQTRDVIGQAEGVLMARGAEDEHAAFALLVSASQRSNVRVNDVARRLIASVLHGRARPPG